MLTWDKMKDESELVVVYEHGQPCNHQGCLNHMKHPCEGCGRTAGQGEVKIPKWLLNKWNKT